MFKRYVKVIGISSAGLILMMLIFFAVIDTIYPNLTLENNGGGDKITKLGKITGSSYTLENLNVDGTGAHGLEFENDIILTLVGDNKITADKDGINAKGKLTIQGTGTLTIECNEDGIHADKELIINNGNIAVNKCNEGLVSEHITINGGEVDIISADDGINAADCTTDNSIVNEQSAISEFGDYSVTVNDGILKIDAMGDGIDSSGYVTVNGGTVYSFTNSIDNTAIDADKMSEYDGGVIVVGGTAAFEKFNDTSSNSYVFTEGKFRAGEQIAVQDGKGTVIDFEVYIDSYCIALSSPAIVKDEEYTIFSNQIQIATVVAGTGGLGMRGVGGGIMPHGGNIVSPVTDKNGALKYPKQGMTDKGGMSSAGDGKVPAVTDESGKIQTPGATTKNNKQPASSSNGQVVTTSNIDIAVTTVVELTDPQTSMPPKKFITTTEVPDSNSDGVAHDGHGFWTTPPLQNAIPGNEILEANNKDTGGNEEVKIQFLASDGEPKSAY
ncbi:MAG: carbohydrate-binding domain-containing protein [Ruminococcus sp.]|jgi:hypothetical protein|nr:carbohydrate-binding domain-containing protein [Ruminococcus sp.]